MIIENSVIKEVSEDDPRFKENKDISLSKATLGQFANVLDTVLNPARKEEATLMQKYCDFLDCSLKELRSECEPMSPLKGKVLRYALYKHCKYDFVNIFNTKEASIAQDLQVIDVGFEKQESIPYVFHAGVKDVDLIIKTYDDGMVFTVSLFYKNGNTKIEDFRKYICGLADKYNFYKSKKITSRLKFLPSKDVTWKDLIVDKKIKDQIKYNVLDFFKMEETYKKNGISSKCGLIWEGPPGTGKTLAAQVLANSLSDITFIWVTPDSLYSQHDVSELYKVANELSPTIVFFEDADLFCADRSKSSSNPILGEILNQLDGFVPLEQVVTIFTTNDPNALEQALIDRPGRFDERVLFLPPDKEMSIEMIQMFLKIPEYNKEDLDDIATLTESIKATGAHLKRLCDLATINAIKDGSFSKNKIAKISKEHFTKAFENIKDMRVKAGDKVESQYLNKYNVPVGGNIACPVDVAKESVEIQSRFKKSSGIPDEYRDLNHEQIDDKINQKKFAQYTKAHKADLSSVLDKLNDSIIEESEQVKEEAPSTLKSLVSRMIKR